MSQAAGDSAIHNTRSSDAEPEAAPVVEPVPPIVGRIEPLPRYARRLTTPPPRARLLEAATAIGAREWDESVINVDDRVRVDEVSGFPWRAICALRIRARSGRQYVGTGFFASPHMVVTAGHCVYLHRDGGWPEEVTVIPALAGSTRPFGAYVGKRFRTVDGWVSARAPGSDYGAVLLDEPVGQQVGFFSVGALSDEQLKRSWANISGYPLDRDDARMQYFHARLLIATSALTLLYDVDTFGGQSGSPIWFSASDGRRIAIGIHTSGGARENSGTRITGDVLANLREWRANTDSPAMMAG